MRPGAGVDAPEPLADGGDPQVPVTVVQQAIAAAGVAAAYARSVAERAEADERVAGPDTACRVLAEPEQALRVVRWLELLEAPVRVALAPEEPIGRAHPEPSIAVEERVRGAFLREPAIASHANRAAVGQAEKPRGGGGPDGARLIFGD